jgi:hypothetical protein
VFLGIFVASWRASRELGQAERHVAQGMLVSIGVGSLFNSLLLGFTGGLFFSYFAALCFASLAETTAKNVTVPPLLADGKTGSAPPADDESHARAA